VQGDWRLLMARANEVPRAETASRACVRRRCAGTGADFFGRLKRGFTVFVRVERDADLERLAQSQGATQRSDAPCMMIDRPVAAGSAPAFSRSSERMSQIERSFHSENGESSTISSQTPCGLLSMKLRNPYSGLKDNPSAGSMPCALMRSKVASSSAVLNAI
jgi:hypothetical protein